MKDDGTQSRTWLALSLFEARERIADTSFLPSDDARPDGWPEWRRAFPEPVELDPAVENSPRKVLTAAGLFLAVALVLTCVVSWLFSA